MDKVRLGVVGLGWWGAVLARAVRASGAAEVVSCFSRSAEARDRFAVEHGCRAAGSLDALLSDPEIEAVLIATPHTTHADVVEQAASAGKHVFVEKPLTLSVEEGLRAIRATTRAGVTLQVGHSIRRQPANRRIKHMIETGALGTLLQLDGYQSGAGPYPSLVPWRLDPREGGAMTAHGVHQIDCYGYFAGPARQVFAFSSGNTRDSGSDDAMFVTLEYQSGVLGCFGTSYASPPVASIVAFGSDAVVWNEDDGAKLFLQFRSEPGRHLQDVETIDVVADEMAEFAGCVRQGNEPETGGAEGLEATAVLQAVMESVKSRRPVDVDDFRS